MTRTIVLASILLLSSASMAHSQNAWRDILERQMTAVGNKVAEEGYGADPNAFHTDMIVGVCDGDCTDLDLSLLDLNGNLLFEDELDDERRS